MKCPLIQFLVVAQLIWSVTVYGRDSLIDKVRYKGAFWSVLADLELMKVECSRSQGACSSRAVDAAQRARGQYDTIDHRFAGHELLVQTLDEILAAVVKPMGSRESVELAKKFEKILLAKLDMLPLPAESLSLELGKKLYFEHCSSCHGTSGNGDGALSSRLRSPPSSFSLEWRRDTLTPLSIYAVMVNGSKGTEMTSFVDALSQDEMWNVAFYIATLPYQGKLDSVSCAKQKPARFDLYQLMTSTDLQLDPSLVINPTCEANIAYLRRVATYDALTPRERDGQLAARGSKSARGLVLLSMAIAIVSGGFAWILTRRSKS